jgi:hypothetical protein
VAVDYVAGIEDIISLLVSVDEKQWLKKRTF